MGKIDSSMGFSINEDGSITRTEWSVGHQSKAPDFIPTSLSTFKGGFWKKILYIFCYLLLLFANGMSIAWLIVRLVYENDPLYIVISPFIVVLVLDLIVGIPLIKAYPCKKHTLKFADYVQSNLKSNYGYPYIMTDNHIGVLNTHTKKVIVPPNYDCICWVIPQNVLCAEVDDKKTFFDVKGKDLTNVPTSYYSAKISI